jgi:hypothetical protein
MMSSVQLGGDAGHELCNDSSAAEQFLKQEQVEKQRCVKRTAAFVASGARGLPIPYSLPDPPELVSPG